MQNTGYTDYRFSLGNSDFMFFIDTLPDFLCSQAIRSRKHSHKYFELFYVSEGYMNIETENELSFSKGELVLVSPNAIHSSMINSCSNRITLAFTVRKSSRGGSDFFTVFDMLSDADVASFKNFSGGEAFSRLIRYSSGAFSDKEELIISCLREIIILLKASANKEPSTYVSTKDDAENYRHYIIDRYLSDHYKDGSLKELAEILHLSAKQTARIVKKLYKQSFRNQALHIKMLEAEDYLRNTKLSVEEIATMLGYINSNNFYTAFKKHCGMSPLKYRKSI